MIPTESSRNDESLEGGRIQLDAKDSDTCSLLLNVRDDLLQCLYEGTDDKRTEVVLSPDEDECRSLVDNARAALT